MDIENEVVESAVETPVESVVETSTEVKNSEPGTPSEPKPEDHIPKGVQKRIDRAVRQKYEAEARAKMLEERVAAMEARQFAPQQAASKGEDEPLIDNFDNFDEYVAAKAEYIAKRQIEQAMTAREREQQAERHRMEQAKIAESWGKKLAKATEEIPDFEEALQSSDLPMTPVMRQAIMESDIGPKLAYHLATHPEEAIALSGMSEIGVVRALGRLEERLSGQKPEIVTTNAPKPIVPVGTRASVRKDPGKMSDAEYEKWRKSA